MYGRGSLLTLGIPNQYQTKAAISRYVQDSINLKLSRTISLRNNTREMIDWRISPKFESIKEREWFFPSFEIQEYLLPQINVGKPYIDEYGDTSFTTEDCVRLKGNIEYLIDSCVLDRRKEIKFDSFEKGLVTLPCEMIKDCLIRLHEAAEQAVSQSGSLMFLGD